MKLTRAGVIGLTGGCLLLASVTFAGVSISPASAQAPITIPPLPPTFPCPLCGPSGSIGDGTRAWTYPLHFCPNPDGSAEFAIVYGLGDLYTGSPEVTFFGSIQGIVRQLMTLRPGDRTAEYPTVNVAPGDQYLLSIWGTTDGTENGPRVLFYDGSTLRQFTLICECPTPQTFAVPTTVPGATTVPVTTVPGSPTTVPVIATTVPSLPETGAELPYMIAAVGLVVAYFGWLIVVHVKKLDDCDTPNKEV